MGRLAVPALVLVVWLCGSGFAAQDTGEAAAQTEASGTEEQRGKMEWLRLYVSVARGAADADPMNSSISTSLKRDSENELTLEQVYNRAAFGWKLAKGKGDFRLVFTGFKEDGYQFTAVGREARIDASLTQPSNGVLDTLDWWTVNVVDGNLHSEISPPQWFEDADTNAGISGNDANSDGWAERSEVFYLDDPALAFDRMITDDLQNRLQTVDVVYGRDFGKRLFTGHWWGGLRYSIYEGNVPAAAWLKPTNSPNCSPCGEGYTDGAFLKFINFHQQYTGAGGMGAVEFDFNFFNSRLSLFMGGQFAFLFGNLDADSGDFATLIYDTPDNLTIPARLTATRRKTTWQTGAEVGTRVNLTNGLQFELAYYVLGHLDVVLLPSQIRIPEIPAEASEGSSALYNTQDLVFDGWRAGVAFQF